MSVLNAAETELALRSIPEWTLQNGEIVRTFPFADFSSALRFVNLVGEKAEEAGHHPDIDIRYNKVRLGLVSHDAGGLTKKDFSLASQSDGLFEGLQ